MKFDVIFFTILAYFGMECLFYYHHIIHLSGNMHTGETGKQVRIVHSFCKLVYGM